MAIESSLTSFSRLYLGRIAMTIELPLDDLVVSRANYCLPTSRRTTSTLVQRESFGRSRTLRDRNFRPARLICLRREHDLRYWCPRLLGRRRGHLGRTAERGLSAALFFFSSFLHLHLSTKQRVMA